MQGLLNSGEEENPTEVLTVNGNCKKKTETGNSLCEDTDRHNDSATHGWVHQLQGALNLNSLCIEDSCT
jgi:hypothetical protein